MANKKISELAAAASLDGTELVECVQSGVNVKTTTGAIAQVTACSTNQILFASAGLVAGSGGITTDGSAGLVLGGAGAAGSLSLIDATGSTTIFSVDISGFVTLAGNITPNGNGTQDIGSDANRFGALWLAGSSLHLGNAHIKDTGSGTAGKVPMSDGAGLVTFKIPITNLGNSGLQTFTSPTEASGNGLASGDPFILSTTIGIVVVKILSWVP